MSMISRDGIDPDSAFDDLTDDNGAELAAKEILRQRTELEEILAGHTGQSVDKIHRDTDRDFVMSAAEAKEYGIIDEVIAVRESAPSDAAATA